MDPKGSANHAYYVWVDRYNTLGLGANVPIACANGGESLLALVNGAFVNLRVPYPLGFFSKNVDGRIDDRIGRLEGPRYLDHLGDASELPQRRRQGRVSQGVQDADAARPVGPLSFPIFTCPSSARRTRAELSPGA